MDNKLLGVIIIGFGLLVLFSEQEYSWIVSALSVGVGAGFLIRKTKNKTLIADYSKARKIFNFKHETDLNQLIRIMIKNDLNIEGG